MAMTEVTETSCRRPMMKKREACVFETTKTWKNVNLVEGDERGHDVTAHWEGLLTGKLVVLVDGEVQCIQTRDQQDHDPMDPFGHFYVNGHELEVFPTTNEWSLGESSMNLFVDGHSIVDAETNVQDVSKQQFPDYRELELADAARSLAHQVPAFFDD